MRVEGDGSDMVQLVDPLLEHGLGLGLHERAKDDERGNGRCALAFIGVEDPVDEQVAIAAAARSDQYKGLFDAVGQAVIMQVLGH